MGKSSPTCFAEIFADGIVGHKSTFDRFLTGPRSSQTSQKIRIDQKRCPPLFGEIRNIELMAYGPYDMEKI